MVTDKIYVGGMRVWTCRSLPPSTAQGSANKGMMDFVRRRRWVRKRRQVAAGEATRPAVTSSPSPASTANTPSIRSLQTAADQRAAEGSQTPLGTVAAGDRLPLPQGWSARGSQLQVSRTASRRMSTRRVSIPPPSYRLLHQRKQRGM